MANLAGFIPQPGPGAVYGGNWSQDYGDVMNTLVEAQRAQQQNQFAHSPFGGSFNRRFGGAMPAGLSGAMPQQQEAMPDLAALQGALAQAMQGAPGTNMMEGLAPGGGDLAQHSGAMQQQPWYDEYLAAHEGGAQLPMLQNMGGRGLNEVEQAGIQDRRQQRLGGTLPMADRRANVRNNAIAESEQRSVRMGDMSGNQQFFNELSRLQGALGGQGGGDKFVDLFLGGPQFAADNHRTDAVMAEIAMKKQMMNDPELQYRNYLSEGGTMSREQFMREIGVGQPGAIAPALGPVEAAAAAEKANSMGYGDISRTLDSFQTTMPNASPQELLKALAASGITRQGLQGYVEDQPSMPYGFNPGPLTFLPWLVAGENEEEMKARQVREAYAKQLLGVMGQ